VIQIFNKYFHLCFYGSSMTLEVISQFFCVFSCYFPSSRLISGVYIATVNITAMSSGIAYLHVSPTRGMGRQNGKPISNETVRYGPKLCERRTWE
jgi:hypothetical protein